MADVLASVAVGPFLKKWGIKDKKYKSRLIDKLRTQFSLAPAPRTGRPPKYNSDQLAVGQAALTSGKRPYHSKAALVRELKEEEQLPAAAKQRGYVPALQRHLAGQGMSLGYGTRAKQQPVTTSDEHERLKWCRRMQKVITDTTVKCWAFEDEKQIGSSGKARGEPGG